MLRPFFDLDKPTEADGGHPATRGTEIQIEALRNLVLTLVKQMELLGGRDPETPDDQPASNLHEEVRRFEIELINSALYRTHGHQLKAAQLLGIKTTTLNSKIRRYHIMLPFFRSLPEETH